MINEFTYRGWYCSFIQGEGWYASCDDSGEELVGNSLEDIEAAIDSEEGE